MPLVFLLLGVADVRPHKQGVNCRLWQEGSSHLKQSKSKCN
uniref:Uncharacterized protein n=1 Tax=Siphoviridae sp. ct2QJ10 TaxID=2825315 RepID=A0A8S5P8Z4_9CAUD|nr:MAG TPA: hypothetical protein [Siphoviridae sp. ct2QJ10]